MPLSPQNKADIQELVEPIAGYMSATSRPLPAPFQKLLEPLAKCIFATSHPRDALVLALNLFGTDMKEIEKAATRFLEGRL